LNSVLNESTVAIMLPNQNEQTNTLLSYLAVVSSML